MVTETYRDIEITLLEDENKWRFTANGRERTAPTLPKAREYIDNALDAVKAKKEKPWEPFEAWYSARYGRYDLIKAMVTSEAETRHGREFWITYTSKDYRGNDERKREKVSLSKLFQLSPENDAVIQRIRDLEAQSEKLDLEIREARGKLMPISIPADTHQ